MLFISLQALPLLNQCRSHQVLSGQVRSACISTIQLGGSGGMLPRKFLECRLLHGPFLGHFSEAKEKSGSVETGLTGPGATAL